MRRWMGSLVLASWAALFWYLMISERTSLYLSPRTSWVAPLGAGICTMALMGKLLFEKRTTATGETGGVGLAFVALPVVVVLALPPASLGSYAAGRRSSFVSSGYAASPGDVATGDLSLLDVAGALREPEVMEALSKRAGTEVDFVGIVVEERGMKADEFMLTRFLVSCCVADALSVQVRVVGVTPGKVKEDEWVRVTGKLYPLGNDVILDSSEVESVDRPKHPYLSP